MSADRYYGGVDFFFYIRQCFQEFKSHKKEASQLFLFNLDKDPGETTNLAQLNPAKVDRLKDMVKSLAKVY